MKTTLKPHLHILHQLAWVMSVHGMKVWLIKIAQAIDSQELPHRQISAPTTTTKHTELLMLQHSWRFKTLKAKWCSRTRTVVLPSSKRFLFT